MWYTSILRSVATMILDLHRCDRRGDTVEPSPLEHKLFVRRRARNRTRPATLCKLAFYTPDVVPITSTLILGRTNAVLIDLR